MRIGGGEEELPSCSTSCSQSRESSVDSLRKPKNTPVRIFYSKSSSSEFKFVESTSQGSKTTQAVQPTTSTITSKIVIGTQKDSNKLSIPSVEFRPKKISNNFR